MSIQTEIQRLQGAKSDLKTAIENKGAIVPSNATLDQYPAIIATIQTQGTYQQKTVTPDASGQTVSPDTRL